MTKILSAFICAALGAVALTTLAVGWTVVEIGHHAAFTLGKFDATLSEVNRPCGGTAPCGTLADVAKTLNTVRGTFGQIEIAANHENKNLTALDKHEATLFADTHAALVNIQGATASVDEMAQQASAAIKTTNTTIEDMQPVLANASIVLGHADASVDHLNTLLDMPEIPETVKHAASITASADRIVKDGADEADKLVHPPVKKVTFWGAIDGAFLWIHSHLIPPIF